MKTLRTEFMLVMLAIGVAQFDAPHIAFASGKANPTQNVTVAVDGSGYHPATLSVKAGTPVRLKFVSKGNSCANQVSIPALKKTFSLQPGQKKEIVFTPKRGQTIAFTCSMKMFKGKVTAK